ncbi:MAG: hypothetical protein OXQ29_26120 [Rhodospirillaceae bacterium]|nr:hypothetical protein [Rhodospirillaceae bacterium]
MGAETGMSEQEWQDVAYLARLMGMVCVRNTSLEAIHAGKSPVSKTGDYSDVMVVDAEGRRIPWPEVSQFDGEAMRELRREIVYRQYTFRVKGTAHGFQAGVERSNLPTLGWEEPKLYTGTIRGFKVRDRAADKVVSANEARG